MDNVGKGDVIVSMIVLVLLVKGSKGFANVISILIESCFMDVGKKDQDVVIGIKAEVVGHHLVDSGSELFHVDLEQFLPVKLEAKKINFQGNHFTFGGVLGHGSNSKE